MPIFLALYIVIYGSMNLYGLARAKAALGLGFRGGVGFAVFGLSMVVGPIMVRALERAGAEIAARGLALVVFFWFGFIFIFFCTGLVVDLYRLAVWASAGRRLPLIGAKAAFLITLSVSCVVFGYGVIEARGLSVERVSIKTPLPKGSKGLKIVQISDLHLGPTVGEARLKRVIEAVRAESPDIVVSTGDLVDGLMADSDSYARMLAGLEPPLGKFAVMGNHEFYAGEAYSAAFHEHAGFRLLRGGHIETGGITIAGVDFPMSGYWNTVPDAQVLAAAPKDRFLVYLRHAPPHKDETVRGFGLMLSGHTHNGQIFPFNHLVRIRFPYITGLYTLPEGGMIYISRGTGVWGPPVRVLSPPEITVIEILPE